MSDIMDRKRRATDDNDRKEKKRFNTGGRGSLPVSNVNVKVLVSNLAAGGILGKGGEKCLQLMQENSVFMKISKFDKLYPGKMIARVIKKL